MGSLRQACRLLETSAGAVEVSIGDSIAPMHGVMSALIALHQRKYRRQKGQAVEMCPVRISVQSDRKPTAGVRYVWLHPESQPRVSAGH